MTDPTPSKLGAYLNELRLKRSLSLAHVAEALDFDPSFLFYIETGKRRRPDPEYLHRLARFYGVLVEDLYALAGYTPPRALPELPAYLRTKYDLPETAITEIADFMDFLAERHGARATDQPDRPAA